MCRLVAENDVLTRSFLLTGSSTPFKFCEDRMEQLASRKSEWAGGHDPPKIQLWNNESIFYWATGNLKLQLPEEGF